MGKWACFCSKATTLLSVDRYDVCLLVYQVEECFDDGMSGRQVKCLKSESVKNEKRIVKLFIIVE